MDDQHLQVVALVKEHGYRKLAAPVELASGQLSADYVDGKRAVAAASALRFVGEAMIEVAREWGVSFTAAGGLTMGADPFAISVALLANCNWFSVRKAPKERGLGKWIEGADLGPKDRVLLVDDVVTLGGSIMKAFDRVEETGATVVGVVAMVDRGDTAAEVFAAKRVPYRALVTYRDLEIEPVNGPQFAGNAR